MQGYDMEWRRALLTLAAALLIPQAAMADDWQTEGMYGQLYVRGALLASACGLTMDSATQEVWLGETGTASLQQPGDRGEPVNFSLRLTGCAAAPAMAVDERHGTRTWSPDQPVVTVTFYADTDTSEPFLAGVSGVSGLGLRLDDAAGRQVHLNEQGRPALVSPGGSELVYTVTPVRTPAALTPGAWRAVINFGVRYD